MAELGPMRIPVWVSVREPNKVQLEGQRRGSIAIATSLFGQFKLRLTLVKTGPQVGCDYTLTESMELVFDRDGVNELLSALNQWCRANGAFYFSLDRTWNTK